MKLFQELSTKVYKYNKIQVKSMAVALKYFGVTAIFKSKYLRNTLFYCIMQINNLCVDNLFYWRKIWEMKRLKAGYIL